MDDLNEKSWRIPERLGYRLEGVLHNYAPASGGQVRNMRIYAKVV